MTYKEAEGKSRQWMILMDREEEERAKGDYTRAKSLLDKAIQLRHEITRADWPEPQRILRTCGS